MSLVAVYPCTYRELLSAEFTIKINDGISLYLQGTQRVDEMRCRHGRYIPVPTGNSVLIDPPTQELTVYPCTYRELSRRINFRNGFCGISLYLQGTRLVVTDTRGTTRYIPVPTGNSNSTYHDLHQLPVYPCTYRELHYQ